MKAHILTFVLIFLGAAFGIAEDYPTKQIDQYKRVQEQTIALPTQFAKPFIIDQKDIDLLAGKTIHHIELIYTQYAESESFNQEELNNERIAQLKKLLPQVLSDKPNWTWLEQTGAKTRDVASNYFHGFVIHYGDKLDHPELGEFFSELAEKKNQFEVYYPEGGDFEISTGSTIRIAPNAVTYMDGSPVSGYYTLFYSEYRNPAQITFSGLPMEYNDANFSSVGMYELRAEKDGKELKLIEPIQVDFNCTKIVDDASFFSMNDETGEWKKEHDIQFNDNVEAARMNAIPADMWVNDTRNLSINWQQIDSKTTRATLNKNAWNQLQGKKKRHKPRRVISCDTLNRSFIIKTKRREKFEKKIMNNHIRERFWKWNLFGLGRVENRVNQNNMPGKMQGTLLAENADAGHTYPTIVKGLNSPSFGVYNCDQVYRIGEIARVSARYKDTKTGEYIKGGHVACVMDLSYNGSFSFHPNNLTLNKNGRNAILLFTQEKEIYLIDEHAFAELNLDSGQTVTLPMENVTDLLKSPEDLKKMLNI